MRAALLAGLLLGLGLTAAAQVPPPPGSIAPTVPPVIDAPPTPTHRSITAAEVEVRCGGSEKFYSTSKLKRGDKVVVVRPSAKFSGWLEIRPPVDSISWINALVVKQTGPFTGVVVTGEEAEVPVLAGSRTTTQEPNIESARVKRGTLVVILDRAFQSEKGSWLPIEPTPGEVRYIPASAVEGSPVEQVVNGRTVGNVSSSGLIAQAEQAFRNNNLVLAKQLYIEAANSTNDANERNFCYSRINQLVQATSRAGQQPGPPTNTNAGGWAAQNASQTTVRSFIGSTTPAANPFQTAQRTTAPQWGPWGYLRRTRFTQEGQPVYVVESQRGDPLAYVTTTPNLSLESYVGRLVCPYGTVNYRSDDYLRTNIMTVSHVALPPR